MCSEAPAVRMSPPSEQVLPRKSTMKGGGRRVSCVTFGENSVVEIETCRDMLEKEDKENDVGENKEKYQEEGNIISFFVSLCKHVLNW